MATSNKERLRQLGWGRPDKNKDRLNQLSWGKAEPERTRMQLTPGSPMEPRRIHKLERAANKLATVMEVKADMYRHRGNEKASDMLLDWAKQLRKALEE